jgi:hypothetical protein
MKIGYPSRVIITENIIGGSTKRPQQNKKKFGKHPHNASLTFK